MATPTVTKKRFLTFKSRNSRLVTIITGGGTTVADSVHAVVGKQETVSKRYSQWPGRLRYEAYVRKHPTPSNLESVRVMRQQDWGSEFWTSRNYYKGSDEIHYLTAKSGLSAYSYYGPLEALSSNVVSTNANWPIAPSFSTQKQECWAVGASAISKCLPTNPVANLSTTLGELFKDGIPSMIGLSFIRNKTLALKDLGDEYLNVEFGWKPFLSDLKSLIRAIGNHSNILLQLERDSGRGVRRRYYFPEITSTAVSSGTGRTASPPLPTAFYFPGAFSGPWTKTTVTKRKFWFSGEFSYLLVNRSNTRNKLMRYAQEAEKLLGLRITPEVLWNLAPWSWLADWFANVGSIATNVSRFSSDGLIMRYGYCMCTTDISDTYTLKGIVLSNGRKLELSQTFGVITKIRAKASPFGFGLDPGVTFSTRQWAILAALGISQGRLGL